MKPIYIFDIDGTLANVEHRVHFIQQNLKDWKSFFSTCERDEPIFPVIETLKKLRKGGAEIWIWSGRSDEVKKETVAWLRKYDCSYSGLFLGQFSFDSFKMRKVGDHRPDTELKYEWLSQIEPPEFNRIVGVFEDRASVVDMWRKAGITCFQVAPGEF